MLQVLFLLTTFLFTFSHDVAARDFCVADLKSPESPAGYPCKSLKSVTVDDFVSSSLMQPVPPLKFTNINVSVAFVTQFPALNGMKMGISLAKLAPGGFFPLHSHPDNTEMMYVTSGSIITGFISSANTPFVKTVNKGELMILPQGLFHFVANAADDQPAEGVFSFNNHHLSVQTVDYSLFGNDFDSKLLEKTTSISADEIKRLKGIFGSKA